MNFFSFLVLPIFFLWPSFEVLFWILSLCLLILPCLSPDELYDSYLYSMVSGEFLSGCAGRNCLFLAWNV